MKKKEKPCTCENPLIENNMVKGYCRRCKAPLPKDIIKELKNK